MKNKITYLSLFLATALLLLASCADRDESFKVERGEADFSNYVAFGNSLTAGYGDAALYYEGQVVAYPYLMAQQMAQVGGGEFRQPWVDPSSVGVGSNKNARLVLKMVNGELVPVPSAPKGDLSIFVNSVASEGPFNNMGVPGAQANTSVLPGYGNPLLGENNFNPYFTRMTNDPINASMLGDALAQNPTFFTVFIGGNDVLNYAANGGTRMPITPLEGPPGVGFIASIDAIVKGFTANGAKGAVATVPDITSVPFFTTIPYNGLVLESDQQAEALNQAYQALIEMGLVTPFRKGANGFIITDTQSPVGFRQAVEGEIILITTPGDSLKRGGWGSVKPIPNLYSLTHWEIKKIDDATEQYNKKLKAVAEEHDLAFVDVNKFLREVMDVGINLNGRLITADFVTGGAFALDGIHLTPVANAILANEFIKAINKKYNSSIPLVDPSPFGGIEFP